MAPPLALEVFALALLLSAASAQNVSTNPACLRREADPDLALPPLNLVDVQDLDEKVVVSWSTAMPRDLEEYLRECPPMRAYASVFCSQGGGPIIGTQDYATGNYADWNPLDTTGTVTIANLTNTEHNCTLRTHASFNRGGEEALVSPPLSFLVTPASLSKAECDAAVTAAETSFLGVSSEDDTAEGGTVTFTARFPPSFPSECLDRFRVECDVVSDSELANSMKNSASAIQHRVGMVNPAKQNEGLAILKGLETGSIYTCALRALTDKGATVSLTSVRDVYIEPGFPKVLRDTSKNGAKCVNGASFGLVNATTMYTANGCSGAFLLPGRARRTPAMGILCGAAEGTRTECFLPGGGETLAGAVAADNSAAMAAALEVYSQTSREDCVPGHFGFASMDEMFVLNGCQGSFLYYPATVDLAGPADPEPVVVKCAGSERSRPAYDQKISRRRWWCLFLCRTEADDPNGMYTCPLNPITTP